MIAIFKFRSRLFFILFILVAGCSEEQVERSWLSTVPSESPLIILHHGADLSEVLEKQQSIQLEELSSIQLDDMADMQNQLSMSVQTEAIALYPTDSHQLQPVFVLKDQGSGIVALADPFHKEYAKNRYQFEDHTIHILHLEEQELYATQLQDWIVMSKNSLAVENSILTFSGDKPEVSIAEEQLQYGDFLLNTPKLSNWLELLGAPRYLPRFDNLFDGTGPVVINLSGKYEEDPLYHMSLTGSIPITADEQSRFVSAFSSDPADSDLDRYIPTDAAFFTVFHNNAADSPPSNAEIISPLDSMLTEDTERYQEIAQTLATSTAFAAFEPSGFLSSGEQIFLRRLENTAAFDRILDELAQNGYIELDNNIYYVNSNVLSGLLGGPLGHFTDFYVMRSANAAVITRRSALARRIDQDRRRRAVYYYDDDYIEVRQRHPESVSAWVYSRNNPLMNYLESHLNPVNHARFLAGLTDIGTASIVRNGDELSLKMDTYLIQDRTEPVREQWVYNLGGSRLTGKPLLVDILGGSLDELVVATESNEIFGIAADGTGFLETNTVNDRPVGSPVVYDWYGNNQYAVLVAAGNKIYGWSMQGVPLPNFPVTMNEDITAPLVLADISRSGRPEMIVTTADRQVHVLDQRGRNIEGWPQDVNVSVTRKPEFREFDGRSSLWVPAGNGLFAFSRDGGRRDNFPVFIEADFGPISFHDNHILAGASDGHLYAIGRTPFFADSLVAESEEAVEVDQTDGKMEVRRIYVGNSPIINSPIVQTLTISNDTDDSIREQMIGVQTLNGNLFLLNEAGQLRMTRNMGQPSAEYDNMQIADINGDGKPDMLGVAETGRVYAWQVESGERLSDIPSSSMRYPIVADLLANGETELIGQTRSGLQCWSFRRP